MGRGASHSPKRTVAAALLGCALLAGCGVDEFFRDPPAEPIRAALRTTVPLAYAASVAMAAVGGSPPPNASSTSCSSFPCAALVSIAVDDVTVPLAFASSGRGKMLVAGLWTSPQTAILTVTFVDLSVGSRSFQVRDVSAFPVARTSTGLLIAYAAIDVDVATGPVDPAGLSPIEIDAAFLKLRIAPSSDPEVNLGMDAWVVQVDDAGTPSDLTDDDYVIAGGGQYIQAGSASGSILQLGMVGARMTPGCVRNPVEGLAALQETGTSPARLPVLATALILFEPACTGTARVTLATGNWLLSIASTIPLGLTAP